jgi:uridine kinase
MAVTIAKVEIDNQQVEIRPGTTLLQHLEQTGNVDRTATNPVVIASINGRRASLAEPLWDDDRVRLIHFFDQEAQPTIQRSVLFLLAVAAEELFPEHPLWVNFSVGGGMYCELRRDPALSAEEIGQLEERMWEIVAEDRSLTPQRLGLRALLKMEERNGSQNSSSSTRYTRRDNMTLYRMDHSHHLYFGRQLPSTGYIKAFKLVAEEPGFILLTNEKCQPDQVPVYSPQPKLLHTMRDYAGWVEGIGVQDVGHLNEYIVDGKIDELIQISEARHTKFFVEAARQVADLPEEGRLVLLAGPSSSGKTSSAKRLMIQLRVLGLQPFALSLDNYFVDRDKTPLDEDGDYDFESIDALKLELFNDHLSKLLAGEDVHMPVYDFHSGKGNLSKEATRLERGQPLIVEGIHALNPLMTPSVPDRDKMQIYVSALCHLNIDNFSYIKTTHSRLFRRIVRDAQFRGYTASDTLARWPKVRHGEEKHIFPFQDNADLFFNSGLAYELAVLKLWAEPRLAAVDANDPNFGMARTLIDQLSLILPMDASGVPPTSLLREFIGGSGFRY